MRLRDPVFNAILEALNKYEYCILRNYETLPEYSNDIDVLIEKGVARSLVSALISNLEPYSVKYLYKVQFSCLSVYFFDSITDQLIHIDFFEEIKWKVFEYLPSSEILKTKILYKNFYVPHPLYEMYELLLTRLIYEGKIKDVYKDRIYNLYQRINKEIIFYIKPNFNAEIASKSWIEIEKRINAIRIKIIFRNIVKPIILVKNIFLFIQRIIDRSINPPGLFVAFYGVDGSGKSTQINLLSKSLKGIYSDKVRLFHFRPHFFYKKPLNITVGNPHDQLKTNFLRSLLKLFYYIFIYNWGYLTQILPFIAKNGLVMFDRYYFDMHVDPVRYRLVLPAWFVKFGGKFIPQPHINICLIADEKKIYERKPEIEISLLKRQQVIIKEIFVNNNDYIISTDTEETDTLSIIIEIIIENVRKRN